MAVDANLYAILASGFAPRSSQVAYALGDGSNVSYAALDGQVSRMANALAARGVAPGDRVMVQVEKSLANVYLYLACLKAGAVYNPLNTAYTAAELEYFIGDAKPKVLVVDSAKLSGLTDIAARSGVAYVDTMDPNGSGTLATLAAAQSATHATVARTGDDLAALLYTSGTTGRSKGAMITHRNLSSNALTLRDYWGFTADDVLLHALPIFHVHGLFVALNTTMLVGGRIIWMPKFDAGAVLKALPQATVMMGVPTFYTRLLADKSFVPAHCKSMRLFISGSAPLLAETHVEFETRTGMKILERYGMTETGMITSNPYAGGERLAGTVGYALPEISVRIASDAGAILPAGEVGVLEVKGPNVFQGYWNNPEKTAAEFRKDGYFITGDLSVMAPDGRVSIVGRSKDLIITGGFNVYPKEIEDELNMLPGVAESAVIGVKHPDFGESVVAVVTPLAGATLQSEAEIIAHLGTRLAKFKLPKRVFVIADLPRNAMGKVQKAELRNVYGKTFTG
jgi:malonyl-CoA/methylmalonyl-CoA synthetase